MSVGMPSSDSIPDDLMADIDWVSFSYSVPLLHCICTCSNNGNRISWLTNRSARRTNGTSCSRRRLTPGNSICRFREWMGGWMDGWMKGRRGGGNLFASAIGLIVAATTATFVCYLLYVSNVQKSSFDVFALYMLLDSISLVLNCCWSWTAARERKGGIYVGASEIEARIMVAIGYGDLSRT